MKQDIPTKNEVKGWIKELLKVELINISKEQERLDLQFRLLNEKLEMLDHKLSVTMASYNLKDIMRTK